MLGATPAEYDGYADLPWARHGETLLCVAARWSTGRTHLAINLDIEYSP
jgi:hypothetical protein